MKKRVLGLVVLLQLTTAQQAVAEEAGSVFVQADVLRLRSEPREDAPAVLRVRINTELAVMERREAWARVELSDTTGGWALAAMLGPKPVTVAEAREKATRGPAEERASWAERLVALDGTQAEHWKLLRAAYPKERKAKIQFIDSVLAGKASGYLARCLKDKVVILGAFSATGATARGDDAFDGMGWYRVGEGEPPKMLAGTPFPKKETYEPPEGGADWFRVIGTCEADGALYATLPLQSVEPLPEDPRVRALDATPPRRKAQGAYGEDTVVWLAPSFGGKLLLRISEWRYSWSECEEGTDNCGSEDSRGLAVGSGTGPGKVGGFEVVLEFNGC